MKEAKHMTDNDKLFTAAADTVHEIVNEAFDTALHHPDVTAWYGRSPALVVLIRNTMIDSIKARAKLEEATMISGQQRCTTTGATSIGTV
jgi:hypothetical protein